jgi:hypothetical protein
MEPVENPPTGDVVVSVTGDGGLSLLWLEECDFRYVVAGHTATAVAGQTCEVEREVSRFSTSLLRSTFSTSDGRVADSVFEIGMLITPLVDGLEVQRCTMQWDPRLSKVE